MVVLNLMLCLILTDFRIYTKSHIASYLANTDPLVKSPLSMWSVDSLWKYSCWQWINMSVWIILNNFLNIQQNECFLLITAHPRWSKPESMIKCLQRKDTQWRSCHKKEKGDGFQVLIPPLNYLCVFLSKCFKLNSFSISKRKELE